MKKLLCLLVTLVLTVSCLAQVSGSEFVGTYVGKESNGTEFEVVRIAIQGGKLMAIDPERPQKPFEVRVPSRQEVTWWLRNRPLMPFIADQLSGITTRDGGVDQMFLWKFPVGTVLDGKASTTGYAVIGMAMVEVHKR